MHFFLQGEPMVGKSYLLQNGFKNKNLILVGYTPQRIYYEGEIAAYRVELIKNNQPVIALDGDYDSNHQNIILNFKEKYKKVDILEKIIHEVYKMANEQKPNFIVLDEIGGFEMESNYFTNYLFKLLDEHSCVGVIKHHSRCQNNTENKQAMFDQYRKLITKIENNGRIYTLTENNKEKINSLFADFLLSNKKT